jgi:hypothetical protein
MPGETLKCDVNFNILLLSKKKLQYSSDCDRWTV